MDPPSASVEGDSAGSVSKEVGLQSEESAPAAMDVEPDHSQAESIPVPDESTSSGAGTGVEPSAAENATPASSLEQGDSASPSAETEKQPAAASTSESQPSAGLSGPDAAAEPPSQVKHETGAAAAPLESSGSVTSELASEISVSKTAIQEEEDIAAMNMSLHGNPFGTRNMQAGGAAGPAEPAKAEATPADVKREDIHAGTELSLLRVEGGKTVVKILDSAMGGVLPWDQSWFLLDFMQPRDRPGAASSAGGVFLEKPKRAHAEGTDEYRELGEKEKINWTDVPPQKPILRRRLGRIIPSPREGATPEGALMYVEYTKLVPR